MTEEMEGLPEVGELPVEPEIVNPEFESEVSKPREPSFKVAKQKAREQGRREMADELLSGFKNEIASLMDAKLAEFAKNPIQQQPTNPAAGLTTEQLVQQISQQVAQQVKGDIWQSQYDMAVNSAKGSYQQILAKTVSKYPDLKDSLDLVDWDSTDLIGANLAKDGFVDNPEDVIAALIEDPATADTLMRTLAGNQKRGEAALKKYANDIRQVNKHTSKANSVPAPSGQVKSNPGGAYSDEPSIDDLRNDPLYA